MKYMEKERLGAFIDAVLAIIMTILVLELEKPEVYNLKGFLALKESFFAYALSFFWLGAMWINLHNSYQLVKKINKKTVWYAMLFLFFSSFFPYTTKLIATEFNNTSVQVFYGIIVMLITITVLLYYKNIYEIDVNKTEESKIDSINKISWIKYDISIKIIGLLMTIFLFPQAMSFAVLITLCFLVIPNQLKDLRD